jgi:cytochrome c553
MRDLSDSRLRSVTAIAAILLAVSASAGSADPQAGLAKSAICASCHGPVGISPVPTYPNIAGQNQLYIEYALRRYRAGERGGEQAGMMYTVTQALGDEDIGDLAAYYASLPPGRSYGTAMAVESNSVDGLGLRLRNDP